MYEYRRDWAAAQVSQELEIPFYLLEIRRVMSYWYLLLSSTRE